MNDKSSFFFRKIHISEIYSSEFILNSLYFIPTNMRGLLDKTRIKSRNQFKNYRWDTEGKNTCKWITPLNIWQVSKCVDSLKIQAHDKIQLISPFVCFSLVDQKYLVLVIDRIFRLSRGVTEGTNFAVIDLSFGESCRDRFLPYAFSATVFRIQSDHMFGHGTFHTNRFLCRFGSANLKHRLRFK